MIMKILVSETKEPMVILPMAEWQNVQDRLEELEMTSSQSFRKKIAKARKEKKGYTLAEVKKKLNLR